MMADGSTKPIETIKAGDRVMAFDVEHGGELIGAEVTETTAREVYGYFDLRLANGVCLHVTGEHPFYAPQTTRDVPRLHGEFVAAQWLQPGDMVEMVAGSVEVASNHIVAVNSPVMVHNFNVAEYHTYIANGVLVHNVKERARGGTLVPGAAYLFNESGLTRPEVIVPRTAGYALTRQDAMAALREAALPSSGITGKQVQVVFSDQNNFYDGLATRMYLEEKRQQSRAALAARM